MLTHPASGALRCPSDAQVFPGVRFDQVAVEAASNVIVALTLGALEVFGGLLSG